MSAQNNRRWGRRLVIGALTLGVAVGGYFWSQKGTIPEATAAPTTTTTTQGASPVYTGRIVAQIHGNIPITREELGEYLIARYGREKIKHLINKRIIEQAARAKGIDVTDAEVMASYQADATASGAKNIKEFNDIILKRYSKSDYEWREDVIKPRLILEKMSRARVSVTREDLGKAFQAHYGDKVDCKMLLFPKSEEREVLQKIYPAVRNSEKEFDHYARMQASPSLAAVAGHIKPIGRNTTGSERLEKVLFNLRPGEVSEVLDEPEGLVILKCLGNIPADKTKDFEKEKPFLEKEVFDKKVAMEIGKVFQELLNAAEVVNYMERTTVGVIDHAAIQRETESVMPATPATMKLRDVVPPSSMPVPSGSRK